MEKRISTTTIELPNIDELTEIIENMIDSYKQDFSINSPILLKDNLAISLGVLISRGLDYTNLYERISQKDPDLYKFPGFKEFNLEFENAMNLLDSLCD